MKLKKFGSTAFSFLFDRAMFAYYKRNASAITPEIRDVLDAVDVVSFDVFDTLLLRKVWEPIDVFSLVERECNQPGFAKARIKAERIVFDKMAGLRDPNLKDIYDLMPHYADCYNTELRIERSLLTGNVELLKLWKHIQSSGKRIVVTSDMYLPSDFISQILEKEGFCGAEYVAVSCEENCRKSDGRLFSVLLKRLGVEPKMLLHIGDNVCSDFIMPIKKGCRAWLYRRPKDSFLKSYPFARHFIRRHPDFGHREFLARMIVICHNCQIIKTYGINIGFLFGGPLIIGFVNWLHEAAKKDGIAKLLFVARDGWMPERIFREMFTDIATGYVYAPRIVSAFLNSDGGADADINGEKRVVRSVMGVDGALIDGEYRKYMNFLNISQQCIGVVDGPSKSFSAQFLLQKGCKFPLIGYYVNIVDSAASTWHKSWGLDACPFFVEQLLSSPEHPIRYIKDCKPVYDCSDDENEDVARRFYLEISAGEETCARSWIQTIGRNECDIKVEIIRDWLKEFENYPTRNDICQYERLRHAVNILQSQYKSVFPTWSSNRFKRMALRIKQWIFAKGITELKRERKGNCLIRRVYVCGICIFKTTQKELI